MSMRKSVGKTCLMVACGQSRFDLVRFLVEEAGVDVNGVICLTTSKINK